jgi:hypothetical protein
MHEWNRQIFRFFLVLALGASLAGMAEQSTRPEKPRIRAEKARPEPIVLATVTESALPEQCLLTRRDEDDSAYRSGNSGAKAADARDTGGRSKKKVIACG